MIQNSFRLHDDEYVIMYIRRHIVFLILEIFGIFVLFVVPAIGIWTLQGAGLVFDFKIFGVSFYSLTDIFVYLWAIFCWLYLAEKFTDYTLDFWVLTNKRIVESELIKLFDIQISTLELRDIEDITVRNEGFVAHYFNYGTLEVQTAGTKREFFAERVSDPSRIQKIMFDAKMKDEKDKQDIEKGEIEQIAGRVYSENVASDFSHIPDDQKTKYKEELDNTKGTNTNSTNFDWAHGGSVVVEDEKLEGEIDNLEDKYRTDINKATRIE